MKKYNFVLFCALVLFTFPVLGQKLSGVDFDAIYTAVSDPSSKYAYTKLMDRYKKNDTTLTKEEYKHLYYGYTRQSGYNPYGKDARKKELTEVLKQNNYTRAITLSKEILAKQPFDLDAIVGLFMSYSQTKNQSEAQRWDHKFRKLVDSIMDSGDGLTKETAFVITDVSDEFTITGILGLNVTKQSLIEKKWDLLEVQTPNELGIQRIYFNIEKPFNSLYAKQNKAK